jgi:hypothetical protein
MMELYLHSPACFHVVVINLLIIGTTDQERRWVDNIKMDLREIGWYGVDWIDRAQDRVQWRALVNMVLNLRVP